MREIYENITIDFDGKELFVGSENSSGCRYEPETEEVLIESILNCVMDYIDPEGKYGVEIF